MSNTSRPPEPQISERFTDYASNAGEVSGFVKAVIKRVIPHDFFGSGENKKLVLRMVDHFIKLRRYESFSLHDVLQGLKVHPLFLQKNSILTLLSSSPTSPGFGPPLSGQTQSCPKPTKASDESYWQSLSTGSLTHS
jgi:hypothetical protein